MAAPVLDPDRFTGGRALIEGLRKAGVELNASFWAFGEDTGSWRLVLITPAVENKGPKFLLRQTAQLLGEDVKSKIFDLYDIDFKSPYSASVVILAASLPENVSFREVSLEDVQLGENLFVSMLVYDLDRNKILRANGIDPAPALEGFPGGKD